jgi:hypothetical protein
MSPDRRAERIVMDRSASLSRIPGTDLSGATHLGGPGFCGFAGGLMNPGAVPVDDGIVLLGKATHCHWLDAYKIDPRLYMAGAPLLIELNRAYEPGRTACVELDSSFPAERAAFEDFRLYTRDDRVWVHGVLAELETLAGGRITYWRCRQWHAELDRAGCRLTGFAHPTLDFDITDAEKNWCYFVDGHDLFLLYSLSPFVLLKSAGDLRFQTVMRRDVPGLAGLGGFEARLSLGTNPTPYGPDHLLVMAHKFQMVDGERLYFHWALLIDRRTLVPTRISSSPVFAGGQARGILPGIVYVMAAFQQDDDVFFSICESDSHASFLRLRKDVLDECFVDLPS